MRSCVCLFACLLLAPTVTAADKPNVVILLTDDLGYGDLGCFGHPRIKTPHLDRLARDGLKLTCCYCGAPVCSPSRAALFTGRNPNRMGIHDWISPGTGIFLPRREVTIAQRLKAAGYTTCLAGKWHLNSKFDGMEPTPGDFGFDHWFATQNNAAPTHANPTNFVRNRRRVGQLTGNSSTLIMDEGLKFLEGVADRPFALFLTFHAPHEIVAAPDDFTALYSDVPDETKRVYYGSVSLVDHEVGRLLKVLDDRKLHDNTLVFFTSDNGPETHLRYPNAKHSHGSAGPLRGMKLSMYEGGYRVPGILHWPAHTTPGSVSDEPVAFYDLMPTLCAVAGVEPPTDRPLDGANVLPVLEGKSIARNVPLYWQYDKAQPGPWKLTLRQGEWKLLADEKLEHVSLYNVVSDPGEKTDVAEKYPDRVRELRELMVKRHRDVNGK
jgi:arylsulfatase A